MKYIKYLSILLLVSSCGGGGGGGGVPFVFTLSPDTITTNEDTTYNGSLAPTTNEIVTFSFIITSRPESGAVSITSSGAVEYIPFTNFYGQDEFSYSVKATEKNVTKTGTVTVTVNSVNDAPLISMASKLDLDKNNLVFNSNPSYAVTFGDIDNDEADIVFSAQSGTNTVIPSTFTSNGAGSGTIQLDLSSITKSGLLNVRLIASDGTDSAFDDFTTWLISNKRTVTITQDDDPDDGPFDGTSSPKDYYVYDLIGDTSSTAGTKWLIVADSLANEEDINSFRSTLLKSINALNDSDASSFFAGFFDIVVAEPVTTDGSSPAAIKTGCYDFAETVYCIGSSDIDSSVFSEFLSDNDLISVLTKIPGRGVNLGNTNIQEIGSRAHFTVMHELGHAHGEMGDEYLEKHGRDVARYKNNNVNTTTQADPAQVKWKHWIDDLTNVSGKDYKVCILRSRNDGTYYDDSDNPADDDNTDANCNCVIESVNDEWVFPACADKVGLHEGNYYSYEEDDTYDEFNFRPLLWTIMESGRLEYGKVNAEGFAIGSIHNQGFYDSYDALKGFTSDADTGNRTGIEFDVVADYDPTLLSLKWYVDGVEDVSKKDKKNVTFLKPSDRSVKIYTWKVVDLTGFVSAPDNVIDNTDFYEGLFQSSFYWWDTANEVWAYDPENQSDYNYGYMDGPMGGSWGINWDKML